MRHKSLAITGSIGISTATIIEGSVAHHIVADQPRTPYTNNNIEHPSGKISVSLLKEEMILRKRVPQ